MLCLFLSVSIFNAKLAAAPIADFTFEINGNTVSFTNLSVDASSYNWIFGDGTSSVETNPSHSYPSEGKYIVELQASDNSGTNREVQVIVIGGDYQQYPYIANEFVPPYNLPFRPGTNLGYNPPWSDKQLADLSAGNEDVGVPGIGAKTIRPFLPDHFLEEYEYDVRLEEFEHYASLGLDNNTLIIGFPSEEHRDPNFYCPDIQAETFNNMYTDIWDNGENGTPVNDENHLALYLYKLVHLYGDNITFWEIWNEPGFDYTYSTGWLPPGEPGNWWENNPDPCDYKLRAPIFHYIRTLRICYEVIKYIDPDAQITLGSVGFPSFMDAVLRNTDNPADGSSNNMYPYGGGAYFDVVSIHSYPHFDGTLREWSNDIQDFIYSRHSDKAASGIKRTKELYNEVLFDYGYDGNTFPEKHWIITEINIPRQPFGDAIGSEEAQRNFIIKAYIASIREAITEMHIYDLAESEDEDQATSPFHSMGLYQKLTGIQPYTQTVNGEGVAYKTTSDLLFHSNYDVVKTEEMNLPDEIDGAAFLGPDDKYTYVLWAKTTIDQSEEAAASYSFPIDFNISTLEKRDWDFSETETVTEISANMIALTASPVFLKDELNENAVIPTAAFEVASTEVCAPFSIQYNNTSTTNTETWFWTFEGGTPPTSTLPNPIVLYDMAGNFDVTLVAGNNAGSDTLMQNDLITVTELPTSDFSLTADGTLVVLNNNATNYNSLIWNFGDGTTDNTESPTHDYSMNGDYTITLIVTNECGSDTSSMEVDIDISSTKDISSTMSLQISPNPNKGVFSLSIAGEPSPIIIVKVFDALGQLTLIKEVNFNSGTYRGMLEISKAPGIYWLEINNKGKISGQKILVE